MLEETDGTKRVVTPKVGSKLESVERNSMLYTAEQLPTRDVALPGACRILSRVPGVVDSKPEGAVYQGSWLGTMGWVVSLNWRLAKEGFVGVEKTPVPKANARDRVLKKTIVMF